MAFSRGQWLLMALALYAHGTFLKLHKLSAEKYGSWPFWRDNFSFYKGF